MTPAKTAAITAAATLCLLAGCKKTADNTLNYKSAPQHLLRRPTRPASGPHPSSSPSRSPPPTTPKPLLTPLSLTRGLLTRTTSEKKIIIISKQEINYDLTDKGRSAWTADTTQPGYGNFCYGHRSVSSIDSSTPQQRRARRHHRRQLPLRHLRRSRLGHRRRDPERLPPNPRRPRRRRC